MSSSNANAILRIDEAAECIWRAGEKVGVPPKAFLVLRCLMARPGQLVSKNEILETVWPNTYVSEKVLNNAIGQLREALGDDPKRPSFIETVHRRGFRWVGKTQLDDAPAASPIAAADAAALAWEDRSEFVGRAETLAELTRCYALADAGRRQLVLISGEPGIGKTALVDQFLKVLGVRVLGVTAPTPNTLTPFLLGRGQCVESYGAGDLYRPWREAVERLVRDGGDQTREVFRKHAPSWMLSLLELSTPAQIEALRRSVTTASSESMQREVERGLEAASAECTIVLVLEDLHWSDPATVSLLWALAASREPARLLIIGTYRPVDAIAQQHPIIRLKRELTAKRCCVDLALEGLGSDSVAAFLHRKFPHHELSDGFAACLQQQTAGNPLFLLNALADFERRGWLRQEDGVWRCSVDLDSVSVAVPESTRDLIAFRFEQLAPRTRELLEVASLVGVTFSTQTVAAAADRDCVEVETELEPLARAARFLDRGDEIEWPDGTRGCLHHFRHALYRQVLLSGITPARRQMLHRRIALALEAGYGPRSGEIASPLSHHYEQAGDALRAVDYIELLVQQAYARSAAHEAEVMLRHAVALLGRSQPTPALQQRLLKATIAHGMVLGTLRGITNDESIRTFAEARALGQSLPSSPEYIASLGSVIVGMMFQGRLREAHQMAEEILVLDRGDDSLQVRITAHVSAGTVLTLLGEIDTALQHLERAVAAVELGSAAALHQASTGYDPTATSHFALGYTLCVAGHFRRGRAEVAASLQIARTMVMPWYLGSILNLAASLAVMRRDRVEARQLATESLAFAEQNALLEVGLSRVSLGWVEVLETLDPARLAPIRDAIGAFTNSVAIARGNSILADACLAVGKIEAAEEALDAAFDSRGEERFYDGERLRQRAEIVLARAQNGAAEQAEEFLEQAIAAADAQGTRLFALRATVDLCRLWQAAGRRDQARQRLALALGGFEEGFDEVDLRQANALLGDLRA